MTPLAVRPPYSCVAVDDTDVILRGLQSLPMSNPREIRSVAAHRRLDELDIDGPAPDVLILDYWLEGDRIAVLDQLAELVGWCPCIVLYTSEQKPAPLQEAMRGGWVAGLSVKLDGLESLVSTVVGAMQGRFMCVGPLAQAALADGALRARLTPTEREVLTGLALGRTPSQIATARGVAPSTVVTHVEHIRRKYVAPGQDSVNRALMIHRARLDGWLAHLDNRD